MRAAAAVLLAAMAVLTPLRAAAANTGYQPPTPAAAGLPSASELHRILTKPGDIKDDFFRVKADRRAQQLSDKLFAALQKILGGDVPTLNFIATIPVNGFHASATPALNQINIDPLTTYGLIDARALIHSGTVNVLPHEMAHLRQIPVVFRSTPDAEGGAQAFADIVTPLAAAAAGTYYDSRRNYDGAYAQYVQDVLAQKGRDWIMGGQFGHPPVTWP